MWFIKKYWSIFNLLVLSYFLIDLSYTIWDAIVMMWRIFQFPLLTILFSHTKSTLLIWRWVFSHRWHFCKRDTSRMYRQLLLIYLFLNEFYLGFILKKNRVKWRVLIRNSQGNIIRQCLKTNLEIKCNIYKQQID